MHHAALFGNAVEASAIAVVGIDQVHGHPAIIGVLVDRISGTEIRRASVALEPDPGEQRMNALAQFLAGENLAPAGIDVLSTRMVGPPPGGGGGVFRHPRWRAMRRDDAALVGDAELVENLVGMTHRLPVGLAPHDETDERAELWHGVISP